MSGKLWGDIFYCPLRRKRICEPLQEAGDVATCPVTAGIEEVSESPDGYTLLVLPKHFAPVQQGMAWEFRRYLSLKLYPF